MDGDSAKVPCVSFADSTLLTHCLIGSEDLEPKITHRAHVLRMRA